MTDSDSIDDDALIEAASEAREFAYANYSGYRVGAAILDEQDRVHTGCNVENAAYPLGTCAETGAISQMIDSGGKRIVKIAVIGGYDDVAACTPCGGCRQRIREFADDNTRILVIDDSNDWQTYTIEELLPASFHL